MPFESQKMFYIQFIRLLFDVTGTIAIVGKFIVSYLDFIVNFTQYARTQISWCVFWVQQVWWFVSLAWEVARLYFQKSPFIFVIN